MDTASLEQLADIFTDSMPRPCTRHQTDFKLLCDSNSSLAIRKLCYLAKVELSGKELGSFSQKLLPTKLIIICLGQSIHSVHIRHQQVQAADEESAAIHIRLNSGVHTDLHPAHLFHSDCVVRIFEDAIEFDPYQGALRLQVKELASQSVLFVCPF